MTSQALILTPIRYGWAIEPTGGRRIARFHGPGARLRAQRYLGKIARLDEANSHRRHQIGRRHAERPVNDNHLEQRAKA